MVLIPRIANNDGDLDPLDNEESLVETLGMLGQIARCKYEESSAGLVSIFDPIATQYQVLSY